MCDQRHLLDAIVYQAPAPPLQTVLVVGRSDARSEAILRSRRAALVACPLAALDTTLLASVAPAAVAFPLMGAMFDATQVLSRLAMARFAGRVMIFAPSVPDRDMILDELRELAPGMTLEVIETSAGV